MVDRKRMVVLACAAAAVVLLLVLFFPTRTRQVKKRFSVLREWVRVEGPEASLEQVGKVAEALKLFADPLEVEYPAREISGKVSPREAGASAVRWRSSFKDLDVAFSDFEVTFPADDQALVTTTVHLFGQTAGGDRFDETHELEVALQKGDEGWRFTRFTVVEVLER